MNFELSDLIGLEREKKWSLVLERLYNVQDPDVRRYYVMRASELNLCLEDEVFAAITLAPAFERWAARAANTVEGEREASIYNELVQLMDESAVAPLKKLLTSPEGENVEARLAVIPKLPSAIIGVRHTINWQAYFRELVTEDSVGSFRVSKVNGDILILAHSREYGTLVGPGVELHADPTSEGFFDMPLGWVLHGPRIRLLPGDYSVNIDLEGPPSGMIHFDVVSNRGLVKLHEIVLVGSASLGLKIAVRPTDDDLEVRIVNVTNENHRYRINRILISSLQ